VLQNAGIHAIALPASEIALYPQSHLLENPVLLTISRSGTTTETLWAVERYRRENPAGTVIAISCTPDSSLIQNADIALLAPEAQEQSVAQTRSFTSMMLLSHVLAAQLANDPASSERLAALPDALESVIARIGDLPERIGKNIGIERFFFLGNTILYGVACEAMLKTKEMTCSWSEAFHTLEFRHGPMSVVNQQALVVGLIGDGAVDAEIAVLRHMKRLGAQTLALCEQRGHFDWSGVDTVIELASGLSEVERAVLYLPPLQWIALYRALAKGLDPDQPTNLTAVVEL
jgi:glucosamine--fructose-6-phosphate aminotransferase (isomerizing)